MKRIVFKIIITSYLAAIFFCTSVFAEESPDISIEFAEESPDIIEYILTEEEVLIQETTNELLIKSESEPTEVMYSEEESVVSQEPETIFLDELIEESEDAEQEFLFAAANLVYTRDLVNGISGEDVYSIQERLQELGYTVGSLDGQFGPVTYSAVLSFQKDNNLYEDGVVGRITLNALNQDPYTETSSTTVSGSSDRYLVMGMSGQDIASLQSRLSELGYTIGTVDGYFGPVTKDAVIAFQSDRGLYPDGEVGNLTRNALNLSVITTTVPNTSGGNLAFTRELMNGMNGPDVRQLQQCLKDLGYSVGEVDGIFGNYTEAAVRAFQKDNELYLDGVVGNITTNALNKLISDQTIPSQNNNSSELKKGIVGDNVRNLQKRLQELGYDIGVLDGDFGSVTESAVKEFQKMNGMENPTGIVDAWTTDKLSNTPVNRYGYTYLIDLTTSAGTTKMLRNLSLESEGEDVKALQQRLVDLGYLIAIPKGYFGNITYEALIEFQKQCGLPANGIADESTYDQLTSSSAPLSDCPDYTISELATTAYITDKNYDREEYDIKYIIPHHMAGKMTGANCSNYFVNNGLQNSANYCIGYDGDISVCVPEEFGAWTSSWWAADEQGITIEVSDESRDTDYIPDKAIESLIYLCADLIQRYPSLGGKMIYDPSDKDIAIAAKKARDPEMLSQVNGNILLHNWTSGGTTTCPGQDMQDKLSLVAEKVNELLKDPGLTIDLSEFTKITEEKKQKAEEERLKQEQEEEEKTEEE